MATQPFSDLPPLPKSLSALVSSSNNQWKEMQRLYAMKVTLQEDLDKASTTAFSRPARVAPVQLRRSSGSDRVLGGFNLGGAVSHLRKEMSNLRQLDASLFCQLMLVSDSLNELKASAAAAEERDRPLSTDTLDALSENDELTTYDSSGEEAFSDPRPPPPLLPTVRLRVDNGDQQQPSDVQVIKLHDGKKIYLLKRETLC